jgi:hypothetical protein
MTGVWSYGKSNRPTKAQFKRLAEGYENNANYRIRFKYFYVQAARAQCRWRT